MKFFKGMEHVETVKIHNTCGTCVKASKGHHVVKKKYLSHTNNTFLSTLLACYDRLRLETDRQ